MDPTDLRLVFVDVPARVLYSERVVLGVDEGRGDVVVAETVNRLRGPLRVQRTHNAILFRLRPVLPLRSPHCLGVHWFHETAANNFTPLDL